MCWYLLSGTAPPDADADDDADAAHDGVGVSWGGRLWPCWVHRQLAVTSMADGRRVDVGHAGRQ